LEDLVLAAEGGVSENIDSEFDFDLENISTDAELQEIKCLFCSQNITIGTIIPPMFLVALISREIILVDGYIRICIGF
jgi:hypothetical protein